MQKTEARAILELMGRPPEHLKEALNTMVLKIGSEKGVKILDKKYYDPKPVEKAANLFTAFAEVELELESLNELLMILYVYSPSNLEIISPENLKISNDDLNAFINSLLGRMHEHGAILKRTVMERNILMNQFEHIKNEIGEDKLKKMLTLKKELIKKPTAKKSKKKPTAKTSKKKTSKKKTSKSKTR